MLIPVGTTLTAFPRRYSRYIPPSTTTPNHASCRSWLAPAKPRPARNGHRQDHREPAEPYA